MFLLNFRRHLGYQSEWDWIHLLLCPLTKKYFRFSCACACACVVRVQTYDITGHAQAQEEGKLSFFLCLHRPGSHVLFSCPSAYACVVRVNQPLITLIYRGHAHNPSSASLFYSFIHPSTHPSIHPFIHLSFH